MGSIITDARSNPNLMISEAFLLFFVETVGHYGQHIHTQVSKEISLWHVCYDGRMCFIQFCWLYSPLFRIFMPNDRLAAYHIA